MEIKEISSKIKEIKENEINNLLEHIKTIGKNIEQYNNRIDNLIIKINDIKAEKRYKENLLKEIKKKIEEIKTQQKISEEHLLKEINEIEKNPNTKLVTIIGDYTNNICIKIKTKYLYIHEPITGKCFDLGEIKIFIPINMYGNLDFEKILMFNESKKTHAYASNMQHPHIFDNGGACFGNTQYLICEAYEKNQYNIIYCILLTYLQTCNIEDEAGRFVPMWNEVDPQTKEIIFKPQNEGDRIILKKDGKYIKEFEEERRDCEICGDTTNRNEMYFCPKCEKIVCPDCWNSDKEVCVDCEEE